MNDQPTSPVKYQSKPRDPQGQVHYNATENDTWQRLLLRQRKIIIDRACDEFIDGVKRLDLPSDRIVQLQEVSERLQTTGWCIKAVESTVKETDFFTMLAAREFPAANFIRVPEELDYLQQPDIFHELFGHCPLLMFQPYADFVEWYGKFALGATPAVRIVLCRLFWFTIEFGLMKTKNGLRIYGGGILSSYQETVSSLDAQHANHLDFDLKTILNCSYDYTKIQPQYFILNDWDELYTIQQQQQRILQWAEQIAADENEPFKMC